MRYLNKKVCQSIRQVFEPIILVRDGGDLLTLVLKSPPRTQLLGFATVVLI